MTKKSENYLVIPDLHIPFEAKNALRFCKDVQREYNIPEDNVLNCGDEIDSFFGSQFIKDPNALHTPSSEIYQSVKKLKAWYTAFPKMRLAESNHGLRWGKRAFEAGIPTEMMRKYQEVIEAPASWKWARKWIVNASRKQFMLIHGMGYSGMNASKQLLLNSGISVVHGHTHASAGVAHLKTDNLDIWSLNAGCLIDVESYAFNYGKDNKQKPSIGAGVVIDGGKYAIWIPY